jgi:hypothetical protein
MMLNAMKKTLLASCAALLVAGAATTADAANVAGAVAMLPRETEVAIAMDLEARKNPISLMSLVPVEELAAQAAAERAALGAARAKAGDAGEAAFAIVFDSENKLKQHTFASGSRFSADLTSNETYAVILGDFTAADAFTTLKTFGVGPGPNQTTGVLPSADPARLIYVNVPADGVVLISESLEWFGKAQSNTTERKGLLAGDSAFTSTVSTMGGRTPDLILFGEGAMLKRVIGSNPMLQIGLGPLAQFLSSTRGSALALFPNAQPTLEIHSSFADTGAAQQAANQFQQFLSLTKEQVKMVLSMNQQLTAEQRAEANQVMTYIDMLVTAPRGNSVVSTATITSMPDKAGFKQGFMEALSRMEQQAGGGGF